MDLSFSSPLFSPLGSMEDMLCSVCPGVFYVILCLCSPEGRVADAKSLETVKAIEAFGSASGTVKTPVTIVDSGEL
jgi:hypothetical protein